LNTNYDDFLESVGVHRPRPNDRTDAINNVCEGLFDLIMSLKMEIKEIKE